MRKLQAMNIGVYGDSFVEVFTNETIDDGIVQARNSHWSSLVAKNLNAITENFGKSSTSLWYSYQEFLKNYQKHDLILFAVTDIGRYIKKPDWYETPAGANGYISSYAQTQHYKRVATHALDHQMLTHLEGWFIMSDREYHASMHELMISHMQSLHKNIIFYPCFEESFTDERYAQFCFPKSHCLTQVWKRQLKLMNFSKEKIQNQDVWYRENLRVISGHLTPEMNEYVAQAVLDRITTGNWKFQKLKQVTLKHPADYYYNI